MHRDELLELHEQMIIIKDHSSTHDHVDSSLFDLYDELAVEPSHVHKSKNERKHATFVFGSALATAVSDDELSSAGHIGERMEELADDAGGKIRMAIDHDTPPDRPARNRR